MRDTNYEAQVLELTGRGIFLAPVDCESCDGHGSSMWEPICEACAGEGATKEPCFRDAICFHEVSMCDCPIDFQSGPKGFVVLGNTEGVEWLGRKEFEAFITRRDAISKLSQQMNVSTEAIISNMNQGFDSALAEALGRIETGEVLRAIRDSQIPLVQAIKAKEAA